MLCLSFIDLCSNGICVQPLIIFVFVNDKNNESMTGNDTVYSCYIIIAYKGNTLQHLPIFTAFKKFFTKCVYAIWNKQSVSPMTWLLSLEIRFEFVCYISRPFTEDATTFMRQAQITVWKTRQQFIHRWIQKQRIVASMLSTGNKSTLKFTKIAILRANNLFQEEN